MDFLEGYLAAAEICARTDFADRASVRRHNHAADKMRQIALLLHERNDKEGFANFARLLAIETNGVQLWAAAHWLELLAAGANNQTADRQALELIRNAASQDLGWQYWLHDYETAQDEKGK